jgi:thioredoxin reductase
MNISEIKTVEHDVVVLGAGGAGLRAAIECSMQGLSTGLVCIEHSIAARRPAPPAPSTTTSCSTVLISDIFINCSTY